MKTEFEFTFANIEAHYRRALELGYEIMTCAEFVDRKSNLPPLTLVNRVDIDFSVKKAERLRDIFERLGIKASFFVRLHAPEYNPFSFENYAILKAIRDCGHEIGYHSEIVDQAAIWSEQASDCLNRDIETINRMLEINIRGVASHGGLTGLNNLDFWKHNAPADFGLCYEAYDEREPFNLFNNSLYVSDSEWTRWKCYENGKLREGDRGTLTDHVNSKWPLVYLVIHPDTYFDRHFYE